MISTIFVVAACGQHAYPGTDPAPDGGDWPGNPDATTTFPATMHVDYVRAFQCSDWSRCDT